jgi:AraC-like DNA-binding protein
MDNIPVNNTDKISELSDALMVDDNLEVCAALNEMFNEKYLVSVILLKTKTGVDNEVVGSRTGNKVCLSKSFNKEKVLLALENILNNRNKTGNPNKGKIVSEEVETEINPIDKKLIGKVEKIIADRLWDDSFSVHELGEKIGISRMHLYRKLIALTGYSPSDLIKKARLEKSKELMKVSELNITQIAYETGYSLAGNFSTTFKKIYGQTPSQYRKRYFQL